MDSFNIDSFGASAFTPALGTKMMNLFSQMFFIAFRVGAPVIGALFYHQYGSGGCGSNCAPNERFHCGHAAEFGCGVPHNRRSRCLFLFMSCKALFKECTVIL